MSSLESSPPALQPNQAAVSHEPDNDSVPHAYLSQSNVEVLDKILGGKLFNNEENNKSAGVEIIINAEVVLIEMIRSGLNGEIKMANLNPFE